MQCIKVITVQCIKVADPFSHGSAALQEVATLYIALAILVYLTRDTFEMLFIAGRILNFLSFLAVQNSSIGDLVIQSLTHSQYFTN